jgi:hypothetical protein
LTGVPGIENAMRKGDQMKRDRLHARIPWLIEANAEGLWAIAALFMIIISFLGAKIAGWW